jgi:hypothetical protein
VAAPQQAVAATLVSSAWRLPRLRATGVDHPGATNRGALTASPRRPVEEWAIGGVAGVEVATNCGVLTASPRRPVAEWAIGAAAGAEVATNRGVLTASPWCPVAVADVDSPGATNRGVLTASPWCSVAEWAVGVVAGVEVATNRGVLTASPPRPVAECAIGAVAGVGVATNRGVLTASPRRPVAGCRRRQPWRDKPWGAHREPLVFCRGCRRRQPWRDKPRGAHREPPASCRGVGSRGGRGVEVATNRGVLTASPPRPVAEWAVGVVAGVGVATNRGVLTASPPRPVAGCRRRQPWRDKPWGAHREPPASCRGVGSRGGRGG